MKHHEIIFSLIKIPWDFCIIFFAFFIAKEIRLITDLIPGVTLPIQTIESSALLPFALCGALLYISVFAVHHLYKIQISQSKIWEVLDILHYSFYWFLFFSVGVYLWNGIIYEWNDIPRLIILFTTIIASVSSIILRISINIIQAFLLKRWYISKRNMLIISNKWKLPLEGLLWDIDASKIYNICWYINKQEVDNLNIFYSGSLKELESLLQERKCDEILYIDSDFSKKELYRIWELSRIYGIRYRYITNNFDITKTRTELSLIHNTPVIEIQSTPIENWGRILKRIFDILGSTLILTFLSPLLIIIALIIKIENLKAPVIYKNLRVWQNGKIFHCFKFRYIKWEYCTKESYGISNKDDPAVAHEKSLIQDKSHRSWPVYKIASDPRKTRFWTILEKYSFDEIPQFFNVLLWDMSIVWPRPHQPREVNNYQQYQNRLLTIKPGITGMAQVNGREQNNFEKEAKLDIFYIENWSLLLDLKIIAKTLTIIFSRK